MFCHFTPKQRRLAALSLAFMLVGLCVRFRGPAWDSFTRGFSPEHVVMEGTVGEASREEESDARRVTVHVAGAVREPGVYRLDDGARLVDLVDKAGGAVSNARLDAVNLAEPVKDGSRVLIPAASENSGMEDDAWIEDRLDINRATEEDLQQVPGIGPALSERIVALRHSRGGYDCLDELLDVRGIGEVTLEQLRDHLVVEQLEAP